MAGFAKSWRITRETVKRTRYCVKITRALNTVNLWGVLSNFVSVSVREVYDGGVEEPSILLSQVGSSHSSGAIMEDTIL